MGNNDLQSKEPGKRSPEEEYIVSRLQSGQTEDEIILELVKSGWTEEDAAHRVILYSKGIPVKSVSLYKLPQGSILYCLPSEKKVKILTKRQVVLAAIYIFGVFIFSFIANKVNIFKKSFHDLAIVLLIAFLLFLIYILAIVSRNLLDNYFGRRKESIRIYFGNSGVIMSHVIPMELKPWSRYQKLQILLGYGLNSKIASFLDKRLNRIDTSEQYTIFLSANRGIVNEIPVLRKHKDEILEYIQAHTKLRI